MTDIYKLFKDEIWQPEDCTNFIWVNSDDIISYNKEGSLDDLFNGDGETYAGEVRSAYEKGGYVIFELDSGCRYTYQAIFSLNNEQNEDAWYAHQYEGD